MQIALCELHNIVYRMSIYLLFMNFSSDGRAEALFSLCVTYSAAKIMFVPGSYEEVLSITNELGRISGNQTFIGILFHNYPK